MQHLTKAHEALYRRNPDEQFASLNDLWEHCHKEKQESRTQWHPPKEVWTDAAHGVIHCWAGNDCYALNDWSFSQLCRFAGVSKDTVNRLSPSTASQVFADTLPRGTKPMQVYTRGEALRALHGASYTRLHNADLLDVALEFTTDFEAAQEATGGGTGLYCGEQDMFAFLIDPTGWTEIGGTAFAPGYFLWNSEVGARSVGVQTFWFQAVCNNHIVWDAVEMVEFSRKHTANVQDTLDFIRDILQRLNKRRDKRRDQFVQVVRKAMGVHLDPNTERLLEMLGRHGIQRALARKAIAHAEDAGGLTIFSVVDALTRLSQEQSYAGERTEADEKAGKLLALAA